jgi:membrane-associated phospholipid phosphatase
MVAWMTVFAVNSVCVAQSGQTPSGEHESSEALSEDDIGNDEPVPLMDNFTAGELAAIGVLTVSASAIGFFGEHIVGFPDNSMGPPAPGSVDWEVATSLNPDPDLNEHFLGGVPDRLGDPLLILGTGAYYGFGTVGSWVSDADWIWDTRHEFFAFAGAIAVSEFFVQSLKFAVGRDRPYVVRRCNPPEDPCGEYGIPPERNVEPNRQDNLSFPGGHTAASSAALSFIYLDLSDHLVYHTLRDASPATRFWVGRILPIIPTYGLIALGTYERMYSQSHWFSDEMVGLSVGLAAGNAFYLLHFDDTGDPLRDNRDDPKDAISDAKIMPVVFDGGEIGAGWGFAW